MSKTLGNPLIPVAAASAVTKPKFVSRTVKAGALAVGAAIVFFGGRSLIRSYNRNKITSAIDTNANYRAAQWIFDAIPAGLKKGDGSLLNPFGFISDLANQVALLWQSTDTKRIMDIAGSTITDFDETAKAFKVLYREDLTSLLNKVMSQSDLNAFYSLCSGWKVGNVSVKSTQSDKVGYRVVTTRETLLISVYKTRTNSLSNLKQLSPNVVSGVSLGRFLGNEYSNIRSGDNNKYYLCQFAEKDSKVFYLLVNKDHVKIVPSSGTSTYKSISYNHSSGKLTLK